MTWLGAIASLALGVALAAAVGHRLAARSRRDRLGRLQQALGRSERILQQQQQSGRDLGSRLAIAEKRCARLEHSLVEIPDLAQRLAATRKLRDIPERALDLVQEVFEPRYSVFYRASRGALVALAVRGESEFAVGHRVRPGDGVVGRAALKQGPLTPEDLVDGKPDADARVHVPERGFSLCLPITSGGRTLGVILVGPCAPATSRWSEIGRTIAMITSVVTTGAEVIREQRRLAETDGLTGLMNRTHLLGRAKALLEADPGPRSVGFFLFDVDHFKNYNDTNGHLPGDELLKALSLLLREKTREDEIVGRYGGEEFLIAMPNADREVALRAAERIRALIAATPFPHRERQPGGCVSISGGLSVWPIDGEDLGTLLKRADQALYAAKRAGRNRVCAWATAELDAGHDADPVAGAVSRALFEDQLENGSEPDA